MSVEGLPADQRAVIQLILTQGRSYDDLAGLMRSTPEAIRDRAHAGLRALAGGDAVPPDVADYLLGQQDGAAQAAARERIAGDRELHRTVVGLVRLLAGEFRGSMPQIPLLRRPEAEPEPEPEPAAAVVDEPPRTSLLGGALLIALVIALAAAVVWWAVGRGDDDDGGARAGATATPTATAAQDAGATPIAQLTLDSPLGGDAQGAVVFYAQAGEENDLFFQLAGAGLPANAEGENYGVWITGGGASRFLGFAPPVGEDGNLAAAGPGEGTTARRLARWLDQARRRGRLVVTRETASRPARPGDVVLSGRLRELQTAQPQPTATPSP